MDEGSALLHHLERRFNRWLCSVVIGQTTTNNDLSGNADDASDEGALLVCGSDSDGVVLADVIRQIKEMLECMNSSNCSNNSSSSGRLTGAASVLHTPMSLSQFNNEDDECWRSKYLLIVCKVEIFRQQSELMNLLYAYRQAKRRQCSMLLLVVVEREAEEKEGLSILKSVIRNHPELGILYCTKRIYTVTRQHETLLLQQATSVLNDWLTGVLPDDSCALQQLDYRDLFKIVVRDLHQSIPCLEVFLRLMTMTTGGLIAVLITVITLALISTESPAELDVRQARLRLQSIVESQRLGKREWGWRDTPSAIVALQLNDPSWCFHSESNQRSVDRMEIRLLSEISKISMAPRQRQLTASVLAAYINALLVVYINPRSFHGHDLLFTLIHYIGTRTNYAEYDNFFYASYVISAHNSGLLLDRKYVIRLLGRQKPDGSFPLGTDEAAITILALACFDESQVPRDRFDLTLKYLLKQRQNDGSYGSLMTTALVTQAINATRMHDMIPDVDYQSTVTWMIQQSGNDVVRKNVHLAANLLMALNGKSLTSIRNLTTFKGSSTDDAPEIISISDQEPASEFSKPRSDVLNRYLIPEVDSIETEKSSSDESIARNYVAESITTDEEDEKKEEDEKEKEEEEDKQESSPCFGSNDHGSQYKMDEEEEEEEQRNSTKDEYTGLRENQGQRREEESKEWFNQIQPIFLTKTSSTDWKSIFLAICSKRF